MICPQFSPKHAIFWLARCARQPPLHYCWGTAVVGVLSFFLLFFFFFVVLPPPPPRQPPVGFFGQNPVSGSKTGLQSSVVFSRVFGQKPASVANLLKKSVVGGAGAGSASKRRFSAFFSIADIPAPIQQGIIIVKNGNGCPSGGF